MGSRDYEHLHLVRRCVDRLPMDTILVSGGARGVDAVAEERARSRGLPDPLIFRARWNGPWKRRAGFMRNKAIVEAADVVVAFWDRSSSGTAHTIQLARVFHPLKPLFIFGPDGRRFHF